MIGSDLESDFAPPGSTLFYALQREQQVARLPQVGLFALHKNLHDLVFGDSDLTYVKFGWWREEVDRLLCGKPRHPVTRAIAHCKISDPDLLRNWVVNLAPFVGTTGFETKDELLRLSAALSEPLFATCAALASETESDGTRYPADRVYNTAVAYALFGFIENLGKYLRDGVLPIPRNELPSPEQSAAEVLRSNKTASLEDTMDHQFNRAMNYLDSSLSDVSPQERASQRIGLTISAINRAALREIRRNGCDTVHKHIDITPVRKAWIAWKVNRHKPKTHV